VESELRRKTIYWGAIILGWFEHLRDADLTSSDYKVLFYLCEKMEFGGNKVLLKQKEIASNLHMDKGNVSKCIKKLCEKQFIVKIPSGFMINPHLFYVGKSHPADRYSLREEFNEAVIENGMTELFQMNEEYSELEYLNT
jgi:predicted XRE-type DNA-binding protein